VLVRALLQFYRDYGDDFRVECPTGSGHQMTLYAVTEELVPVRRRRSPGTQAAGGRCSAVSPRSRRTPPEGENLLFYEHFHGDNGAGIGAAHQTGRTGVVASIVQLFATQTAESMLHGSSQPDALPGPSTGGW
jgi:hypothetical protein